MTEFMNYDALGRPCSSSEQVGAGATFSFGYGYNLAGGLLTETYPSGRVVSTTYDAANRPSGLSANSGAATYVRSLAYYGNDSLKQLDLGPASAPVAAVATVIDSMRQLPVSMTVTSGTATPLILNYSYCDGTIPTGQAITCSTNNGNLYYQEIKTPKPLDMTQHYGYDKLNRLLSMAETGGTGTEPAQTFDYDQWGNRVVLSGVQYSGLTPTALGQYNSKNQWKGTGSGSLLADYDLAGNQTVLPLKTFAYDAENRLIASTQPNSIPAIGYAYDGDGRRVQKTVGSAVTTYLYDAMGQLAAEVGPAVTGTPATEYLISDTLGSTRLVLDAATLLARMGW